MTRLARFRALEPDDRQLFLRAWVAMPLVGAALRLTGFRNCHAMLRALSRIGGGGAVVPAADVERVARMVRAAARHGCHPRHCLTESLTLWWLLRRRGVEGEIRIGVRKDAGGLDAHAWVEWRGRPLDERADVAEAFAPLARPSAV